MAQRRLPPNPNNSGPKRPVLHRVVVCSEGKCLTPEVYFANGGYHGKSNWWWLRGPKHARGGFVRGLVRTPADRAFAAQTMLLERGQYVLGCGPAIGGIRIGVRVDGQQELPFAAIEDEKLIT